MPETRDERYAITRNLIIETMNRYNATLNDLIGEGKLSERLAQDRKENNRQIAGLKLDNIDMRRTLVRQHENGIISAKALGIAKYKIHRKFEQGLWTIVERRELLLKKSPPNTITTAVWKLDLSPKRIAKAKQKTGSPKKKLKEHLPNLSISELSFQQTPQGNESTSTPMLSHRGCPGWRGAGRASLIIIPVRRKMGGVPSPQEALKELLVPGYDSTFKETAIGRCIYCGRFMGRRAKDWANELLMEGAEQTKLMYSEAGTYGVLKYSHWFEATNLKLHDYYLLYAKGKDKKTGESSPKKTWEGMAQDNVTMAINMPIAKAPPPPGPLSVAASLGFNAAPKVYKRKIILKNKKKKGKSKCGIPDCHLCNPE